MEHLKRNYYTIYWTATLAMNGKRYYQTIRRIKHVKQKTCSQMEYMIVFYVCERANYDGEILSLPLLPPLQFLWLPPLSLLVPMLLLLYS
jgi:hypothetical protein